MVSAILLNANSNMCMHAHATLSIVGACARLRTPSRALAAHYACSALKALKAMTGL